MTPHPVHFYSLRELAHKTGRPMAKIVAGYIIRECAPLGIKPMTVDQARDRYIAEVQAKKESRT